MKIVADTNIWYNLGQNKKLFEKVKGEPICPSYVNIYEISKSDNLIEKEEISRAAIQKLFHYKSNMIYEPPLVHIAKLHMDYEFDPVKKIGVLLQFTSNYAKGQSIDPRKVDSFKARISALRKDLETAANFFNGEAEKIRTRINNKKEHKKKDTEPLIASFINFCVQTVTEKQCDLKDFDFDQVELLVMTLDHYFKTIETSHMKIQANDWFDFAILAYVQPGDKYWTLEKRWIRLIDEAGCGDYLF